MVGVTLGKRDSLGNPVLGSGGGIIQANDSSLFENNSIGVEFFPYSFVSRNPLYNQNSSFFKTSIFNVNTGGSYSGFKKHTGNLPIAYAILNDVQLVKFFGCQFNSSYVGGFPYGIKGINSSIDMRDYCSAITSNVCTGTLIRNKFSASGVGNACQYAVYLTNYQSYLPSLIDHVNFLSTASNKGHIYLANVTQAQITNCDFLVSIGNSTITRYGLYLDNCTGYRIENNTISGTPTTIRIKNVGMFVNSSGPNANSIYNNTFLNLDQGLWAQNQNVDWTTQVGLKMNCNDFTTCKYDIGVQKGGRYATFVPNYTGVDFTQGIASTPFDSLNVRNTYGVVSCNANAENKFYANTANTFNTIHGSFLGSQYHPTPQTSNSCSDALELADVIGNPPGGPKSFYCPSVFTPTFSNLMLNQSATVQRQNVTILTNSLTTLVDGGNTQSLLTAINSGTIIDGNLKNLLASQGPYLSDEVMVAYYNTNPPYGHDKIIHEINAPVSPIVMNKIYTLNLPSGVLQSILNNQNQNKLSARRQLEAELNLAKTELGLILNEKTRRFTADTTVNPVDSIANSLKTSIGSSPFLSVDINYQVNLINLYMAAGMYPMAHEIIANLNSRENAPTEFLKLQALIEEIKLDPAHSISLINQMESTLQQWAVSGNYFIEGPAKALLAKVNLAIEEEKLYPDVSSDARFLEDKSVSETAVILLDHAVKIYPNPAQNTLFVEMENNNVKLIEVRDVTGKLLISQEIEYKGSINIQNLQNGVYFINLVNGTNLISSKKIAIIK